MCVLTHIVHLAKLMVLALELRDPKILSVCGVHRSLNNNWSLEDHKDWKTGCFSHWLQILLKISLIKRVVFLRTHTLKHPAVCLCVCVFSYFHFFFSSCFNALTSVCLLVLGEVQW